MPMSLTLAILTAHQQELLSAWQGELEAVAQRGSGRITANELRQQTREFLELLTVAMRDGASAADNAGLRAFMEEISRSRAVQGFSADQTASFVVSLKKPLFAALRNASGAVSEALVDETWALSQLIDELGLHTVRTFQAAREDVIARQQQELLELSTPVVKLWDGVLALPMIGTLDSARTQIVMESLLQRIADTGSEVAIIDITGVPTVDTLVAQHLLKTVTAIRLMGADAIISGLRPQIAQTIVHLGVDLQNVTTKATLADALSLAIKRMGFVISRNKP